MSAGSYGKRHRARQRRGWQPIESAPKDGTRILYISRAFNHAVIGFYRDGHEQRPRAHGPIYGRHTTGRRSTRS